jgi:spore coat polysaccharide biosynthesis protein SpsF (cytidylyltransferase family)
MKTAIFLTTRYESTRFKLKHLYDMGDEAATDFLIKRLKKTGLPIFMVTPGTRKNAEYMKTIADWNNIGYFAGDIENVAKRHFDCALTNNVDNIINCDGDDILQIPQIYAEVKTLLEITTFDVVETINLPLGLNVFGYKRHILQDIKRDSAHGWGAQILDRPHVKIDYRKDYNIRLTLDYEADYEVINNILTNCKNHESLDGILEYLETHPEVTEINRGCEEKYWAQYNKDEEYYKKHAAAKEGL